MTRAAQFQTASHIKREVLKGADWIAKCNIVRERGPGNALKTCSERAATRMESLVWEEKLDRIKTYYRDGYTHSIVRHSLRY
jgi:hypothetical protein